MIVSFGDKVQRPKVGDALEFVDFFSSPPKLLFAFSVEAVLTGD